MLMKLTPCRCVVCCPVILNLGDSEIFECDLYRYKGYILCGTVPQKCFTITSSHYCASEIVFLEQLFVGQLKMKSKNCFTPSPNLADSVQRQHFIFKLRVLNREVGVEGLRQACTTYGPRGKFGSWKLLIWPAKPQILFILLVSFSNNTRMC